MRVKNLLYLLISISIFAVAMKSLEANENKNTNSGKIIGTVTYSGKIQTPKKLEITKDAKICGKVAHVNESLIVSKNKGIANVIVGLVGVKGGKGMESLGTEFVIDQNGCMFKPHVALVPVEEDLKIKNSDGILHNIHTFSEDNFPINKAQPKFLKLLKVHFDEPEIVRVVCDVHNWMNGYIAVVDHPYYSVTDENGGFQIPDIPAGEYTMEYWHESLGKKTQTITIGAGETTDVKFEF